MPWPLWLTKCAHFSHCNRRLKYFCLHCYPDEVRCWGGGVTAPASVWPRQRQTGIQNWLSLHCRASVWPLCRKSGLRQILKLVQYHNGFRTFKDVIRFPKSEHFVTGSVTFWLRCENPTAHKMEFYSGTLFQWTHGSKFFIPCYNHIILRIVAAWYLKTTLQKSYFELIFPIFYTWFSLALWVAKVMPWGKVVVGAHLCFHRNSNSFQGICLWYLKRKGERLFQFAWRNSFMWAVCYINAWTPTPGTVNGCPGLVAFHLEHLTNFLWQREKYTFWTFPNYSPNPFGSHLLFQVISNFGRL